MTKALAARGACVVLVDMNPNQLESAEAELTALGYDANVYIANVAKEEEVVSLFDKIATDLGSLNGLINNAGITRDGLLIKADHGGDLGEGTGALQHPLCRDCAGVCCH